MVLNWVERNFTQLVAQREITSRFFFPSISNPKLLCTKFNEHLTPQFLYPICIQLKSHITKSPKYTGVWSVPIFYWSSRQYLQMVKQCNQKWHTLFYLQKGNVAIWNRNDSAIKTTCDLEPQNMRFIKEILHSLESIGSHWGAQRIEKYILS